MDSGGQCVMMPGTHLMPRWCVDSWAVAESSQRHTVHVLDQAEGPSGWMMSGAQAANQDSANAATGESDHMTVVTARMLVSSVKVNTDLDVSSQSSLVLVLSSPMSRIFGLTLYWSF